MTKKRKHCEAALGDTPSHAASISSLLNKVHDHQQHHQDSSARPSSNIMMTSYEGDHQVGSVEAPLCNRGTNDDNRMDWMYGKRNEGRRVNDDRTGNHHGDRNYGDVDVPSRPVTQNLKQASPGGVVDSSRGHKTQVLTYATEEPATATSLSSKVLKNALASYPPAPHLKADTRKPRSYRLGTTPDEHDVQCESQAPMVANSNIAENSKISGSNQSSHHFISIHDLEGRFQDVSYGIFNVLGYHPTEVKGCTFYNFLHTDDTTVFADSHKRMLNAWQTSMNSDMVVLRRFITKHKTTVFIKMRLKMGFQPEMGTFMKCQAVWLPSNANVETAGLNTDLCEGPGLMGELKTTNSWLRFEYMISQMKLQYYQQLARTLHAKVYSGNIYKAPKKRQNMECTSCSATESPEWRRGPAGPKTLCNACGLRYAKDCRNRAKQGKESVGVSSNTSEVDGGVSETGQIAISDEATGTTTGGTPVTTDVTEESGEADWTCSPSVSQSRNTDVYKPVLDGVVKSDSCSSGQTNLRKLFKGSRELEGK